MNLNDFKEILPAVMVHNSANVDVGDFQAGPGTVINAHAVITGTRVRLGRECWIDQYAVVGGGSCWDSVAFLEAGNWLHLGQFSHMNIARGISVLDEVGIGIGTRVFTHGAYLSEWEGFPVTFNGVSIGSRVWLPNALVNPGIKIGNDVVVASGSVVAKDIPSGALVGGVPAKIIKSNYFPKQLDLMGRQVVIQKIQDEVLRLYGYHVLANEIFTEVEFHNTKFDLDARIITGEANSETEAIKNQLRRHGIRFKSEIVGGYYRPWI